MKKELFIEFLKNLQKNRFDIEVEEIMKCSISDVVMLSLDLTNEQIMDILNTKEKELKVSKFYLYSKEKQLATSVKESIEKHIKNENTNIVKTLSVIEHFNELGRSDVLEFVEAIANAKGAYQARFAKKAVLDSELLVREDAIDIVRAIAQAEHDFGAQYANEVVMSRHALKHDKLFELVKIVSSAKKMLHAEYAMDVAMNNHSLKRDDVDKFVLVVANSEFEYQALSSSIVARDKNVLQREDALAITELLATSKEKEQANFVCDALIHGLLKFDDGLELSKTLINANTNLEKEHLQAKIKSLICPKRENTNNCEVKEDISIIDKSLTEVISSCSVNELLNILNESDVQDLTPSTKVKVKTK